jgi:hypothetical protein
VAEESPSKTQLDKLGDRPRAGSIDEADLRALDDYRRSFRQAYDIVAGTVRQTLKLEGTGRPAKTTAASSTSSGVNQSGLPKFKTSLGFESSSRMLLSRIKSSRC